MTETQENRGVHARMRSRLIHGSSKTRRWEYDHHIIPPISSSSAYRLDSLERGSMGFLQFARDPEDLKRHFPIYIYDRLDEPTRGMLEENLAYAENGEVAVTFASGMAAISAALGITATTGQQIITHNVLYGCTYSLLRNWYPRYNIDVKMVDLGRADVLRDVLSDNTRVVYFETPVNPTMKVIDIEAIREIVDNANAKRTG
ncbi:MAG: aminotransferase class I/II-fold pyridoxal phosphate-dependent enzyme, partial [Candidatus Bathyarchaeia archaeon]